MKTVFHFWLTLRFVTSGRRLLNLPSVLSLVGMTIGVACMVVAMAVVSGFQATLQKSVQDVFGHVMVHKQGSRLDSLERTIERVREVVPSARAFTPFLQLEAVVAREGKISYVLLQGVEEATVEGVLNFKSRITKGGFQLKADESGAPGALIGKGLARKFGLEPGAKIKIVLPSQSRSDSTEFAPRVREFVVRGVLDLGKSDYDERYVVTSLKAAQEFAAVGNGFSGIRMKLADPALAQGAAMQLEREMGPGFYVMHWYEVNENLFEAIEYEKPVLFFILLMMVVAASFNISSNLFVSVLKKFADVSILRAMGFSRADVMKVFTIQGVFFGFIGTIGGILLGLLLCVLFVWIQNYLVLMPADVYKLDNVGVELRFIDLVSIVMASLLVSLLSTLTPAYRGSRLNPVEGLRYE